MLIEQELKTCLSYSLIRSNRKTIAIYVKADGEVLLKAPANMPIEKIEGFVFSKKEWIEKARKSLKEQAECIGEAERLSKAELLELIERAKKYIPRACEHYAQIIGVSYNKISIRAQKSIWGSCSAKGNLSFNCLIMLAPRDIIDSIVVHELCHLKEMNHSRGFYLEVLKACPKYYEHQKWLKQNGRGFMLKIGR